MSGIAHHLARRGLEATQQKYSQASVEITDNGKDGQIKNIPVWGFVLVWATFLMFIFVLFVITYTYGSVVATLTTIESPTATAFTVEPAESEDTNSPLLSTDQKPADKAPSTDPELVLVKTKPITSTIRTTVKHLKAQAGPWSRFRGLQVAIVYHLVFGIIFNLFSSFTQSPLAQSLFAVVTHTILTHLNMTWTHVVISNPSSKSWWRRLPSWKAGNKILLPTAIWATAEQLTVYVPILIFGVYGLDRYTEDPSHHREVSPKVFANEIIMVFTCLIVALFIIFAIGFPAAVTLIRVQASMLPEEDESIVPFDRSFGGKVEPEDVGGTGCIGMLDAWKTFDWAARIRLIKLYVKVIALQITAMFLFMGVLVGELRLILGDDLNKAAKMVHEQLRH